MRRSDERTLGPSPRHLAHGLFRQGSDIDLAVAGLTDRVLARFEHRLTILAHRRVELANLDILPQSLPSKSIGLGRSSGERYQSCP